MWLSDTGPEALAEWNVKMKETPAAPRIGTVNEIFLKT
jgi:hypothetical protein